MQIDIESKLKSYIVPNYVPEMYRNNKNEKANVLAGIVQSSPISVEICRSQQVIIPHTAYHYIGYNSVQTPADKCYAPLACTVNEQLSAVISLRLLQDCINVYGKSKGYFTYVHKLPVIRCTIDYLFGNLGYDAILCCLYTPLTQVYIILQNVK